MKKNREKEISNNLDIFRNEIIDIAARLNKKYNNYSEYIPVNFIEEIILKKANLWDLSLEISPMIYIEIELERELLKYLSNCVRDGNLDIEILLIDEYSSIAKMIVNKLNFGSISTSQFENVLMNALETYDGNVSMQLHITKKFKDFKNNCDKRLIRK